MPHLQEIPAETESGSGFHAPTWATLAVPAHILVVSSMLPCGVFKGMVYFCFQFLNVNNRIGWKNNLWCLRSPQSTRPPTENGKHSTLFQDPWVLLTQPGPMPAHAGTASLSFSLILSYYQQAWDYPVYVWAWELWLWSQFSPAFQKVAPTPSMITGSCPRSCASPYSPPHRQRCSWLSTCAGGLLTGFLPVLSPWLYTEHLLWAPQTRKSNQTANGFPD